MRNRQRCHTETYIYPHTYMHRLQTAVRVLFEHQGPQTDTGYSFPPLQSGAGKKTQQLAFHKTNMNRCLFPLPDNSEELVAIVNDPPKQTLSLHIWHDETLKHTYMFHNSVKVQGLLSFFCVFPPATKKNVKI